MPRAATGYRSLLRTPGAAAFFFTAAPAASVSP